MTDILDDVNVMAYAAEKPQTITSDMPLAKAADKMLRVKIHSVIVTDKVGKPIGVLSSWDIVKTAFLSSDTIKDMQVGKLIEGQKMTFVYKEVSIRDVVNLMVEKSVRTIPILDDSNQLCGLISQTDVIRFMKEKL